MDGRFLRDLFASPVWRWVSRTTGFGRKYGICIGEGGFTEEGICTFALGAAARAGC